MKVRPMNKRYYMSYSTANDHPWYRADLWNFRNLAIFDPGVSSVELFVAVSEVRPRRRSDDQIVNALVEIAQQNARIAVRSVTFKSNVGRDFSSAAANLRQIATVARDDDYILFLNRSALGPYRSDWYNEYVAQYEKFQDVALCGSTISFKPHPLRPVQGVCTHVQSYVYLSQLKHMAPMKEDFPGETATSRLDAIEFGELALSRFMLHKGFALTSLAWPTLAFNLKQPGPPVDAAHPRSRDSHPFVLRHYDQMKRRHPFSVLVRWLAFVCSVRGPGDLVRYHSKNLIRRILRPKP
jgi:hypothetical protein